MMSGAVVVAKSKLVFVTLLCCQCYSKINSESNASKHQFASLLSTGNVLLRTRATHSLFSKHAEESVYLSPTATGTAASTSFSSSAERVTKVAPAFSRSLEAFLVPGMGKTSGPWLCSHARASWAGVIPVKERKQNKIVVNQQLMICVWRRNEKSYEKSDKHN